MSRQWEWMFSKIGEVGLSITAQSEYLAGAIKEANAGLQGFFEDAALDLAEYGVEIQIDPFCHGHLASVTCAGCGADVTRLEGQAPAAVEAAMSEACTCPPDDEDEDPEVVAEQRDIEREARELYAATGDERLRTLL